MCTSVCHSQCTHWNYLGHTTGGVWFGQVCNRKKLPGLRKSYLSEDETGGRGAAIRPLESTPPRIGSSIHLKREMMLSVVVLRGGTKVPARGQNRNSCLSVDGPINQHPPSCEQ